MAINDYEKLGVFYLGKLYDLTEKKPGRELLLYNSKDLVTHAVCIGMTGSGKTGLCISLIEEAAIDGVPAILIDPKGDLPNLLLNFPKLSPADFEPWINEDDARQKGLSSQEYAAQQAALWKKGLADWGQSGGRIQRMLDACDFEIFTPGSNAATPVSILRSFAAPPKAALEDREVLRDRINTAVSSLLSLIGVTADPVQSREHILLSTLFDIAWQAGQDLTLETLIQQVQNPPITKVGVLDLEAFYPSKDRFGLVMALNNLLASPGFNAWLDGAPLEIGDLLFTPQGKPRVAIFSIAHLPDAERMFFVSLLLNQVLSWMRTQSGTTSLRAILYMDEIFGYLPPVSNPPSKLPLLTLLKQARAFGLGLVLATQNPVDLDYKALANAGTWFIGRLQTERDKSRLMDGLEGVNASQGHEFNRQQIEKSLSSLGSRVFLMNNVHESGHVIFHTRWAMSYLRGPLTREQIRSLTEHRGSAIAAKVSTPASKPMAAGVAAVAPTDQTGRQPPALPPDLPNFFLPVRSAPPADGMLVYTPSIVGMAQVGFRDTRAKLDVSENVAFLTSITDEALPVNWDYAEKIEIAVSELIKYPHPKLEARFTDLPAVASQGKNYPAWGRNLVNWVFANHTLELLRSPGLNQYALPGENERDFRIRIQQVSREHRDQAMDKLQKKFGPRINTLHERIRGAQHTVDRQAEQARQRKTQTAISIGATLVGAVLGRKAISTTTLGRATTAARDIGRSSKAQQDVSLANQTLESLRKQLAELEAQFEAEAATLELKCDPQTETFETVQIKPNKTAINVQVLALAWAPYWQNAQGGMTPAW